MAYLFNSLQRMGGQRDNQEPVQKTTAGSEVASGQPSGGSQGSSNTAQKAPSEFTKSKNLQGATQAILERNKGQSTGVGGAIVQPQQKQAGQIQSQLQNEANQYMQQGTDVSNMAQASREDVAKVGSDQGSYQRVKDVLGYKPNELKQFETTSQTTLAPTQLAQTGNAAADLMARRGGGYTAGMGSLDAALFGRNRGEKAQALQTLGSLQKGIDTQLGGYKSDLKGQAEAQRAQKIAQSQNAIREMLANEQGNIQAGLKQRGQKLAQEYGTQQKARDELELRSLEKQRTKGINQLENAKSQALKSGDNRLVNDIQNRIENLKAQSFGNYRQGGDVSQADFENAAMSSQSANAMNAISDLLGQGRNDYRAGGGQLAPRDIVAPDAFSGIEDLLTRGNVAENKYNQTQRTQRTQRPQAGSSEDPKWYDKLAEPVRIPAQIATDVLSRGTGEINEINKKTLGRLV